jgi:hypothetical protein
MNQTISSMVLAPINPLGSLLLERLIDPMSSMKLPGEGL